MSFKSFHYSRNAFCSTICSYLILVYLYLAFLGCIHDCFGVAVGYRLEEHLHLFINLFHFFHVSIEGWEFVCFFNLYLLLTLHTWSCLPTLLHIRSVKPWSLPSVIILYSSTVPADSRSQHITPASWLRVVKSPEHHVFKQKQQFFSVSVLGSGWCLRVFLDFENPSKKQTLIFKI